MSELQTLTVQLELVEARKPARKKSVGFNPVISVSDAAFMSPTRSEKKLSTTQQVRSSQLSQSKSDFKSPSPVKHCGSVAASPVR